MPTKNLVRVQGTEAALDKYARPTSVQEKAFKMLNMFTECGDAEQLPQRVAGMQKGASARESEAR